RTDRTDFLPWGVEGGKPGTPTRNYLNPDIEPQELPGKYLTTLKQGDVYRMIQAGGGGYGDPLERDVYAVLDDVRQEKLTLDHVRREYGVVIDPGILELDLAATEKLREDMRIREGETGR
ncbi:uncharacterized protein METZ01_LOCUS252986, partial [marine metagenome]